METIDIINYLYLFEKEFTTVKLKEFIDSYKTALTECALESINNTNEKTAANEFMELWKEEFKNKEHLLKVLIKSSPKKVFALFDLLQ